MDKNRSDKVDKTVGSNGDWLECSPGSGKMVHGKWKMCIHCVLVSLNPMTGVIIYL